RCTTEQVSVRVIPGTSWTLLTIILPSSSTLRASVRTTTSYGPVTASTRTTPEMSRIAVATSRARPTSVWMRMYALSTPHSDPCPTGCCGGDRTAPGVEDDGGRVEAKGGDAVGGSQPRRAEGLA